MLDSKSQCVEVQHRQFETEDRDCEDPRDGSISSSLLPLTCHEAFLVSEI